MEVHVQPRTRSKMFCGCAIAPLNAEPNTHVCEVCLGLPGVLPVPNKAAVEACLKTALALNCEIPRHTKFDRKNYMYPDLPKGYQISQYDLPMSVNGYLELGGRRVRIRRVHLEEDTGKLIHAGDKLHKAWESYVDLNRAGVPLMEIVSEPDLRSADEARDYAMELRTLLRTVGASEADMEKGQLRAEPNIWASRPSSRTSTRFAPCIARSFTRSSASGRCSSQGARWCRRRAAGRKRSSAPSSSAPRSSPRTTDISRSRTSRPSSSTVPGSKSSAPPCLSYLRSAERVSPACCL